MTLSRYRLAPAAQDDLEDIWRYTVERWSITQADRYADILEDTFERLMFMPEMARERTEFRPPVRIAPSSEHLIVYLVEGSDLVILRVLGAGQDWQTVFRTIDQ